MPKRAFHAGAGLQGSQMAKRRHRLPGANAQRVGKVEGETTGIIHTARDGSFWPQRAVGTLKTFSAWQQRLSAATAALNCERIGVLTPANLADPLDTMTALTAPQPFFYNQVFQMYDTVKVTSVDVAVQLQTGGDPNLYNLGGIYIIWVQTPTAAEDGVLNAAAFQAQGGRAPDFLRHNAAKVKYGWKYISPNIDQSVIGRRRLFTMRHRFDNAAVFEQSVDEWVNDDEHKQIVDTAPTKKGAIHYYVLSGNGGAWNSTSDKDMRVQVSMVHNFMAQDRCAVALSTLD